MGNKEIKWLKAIQLKEKVFFHQKCLSEKSLLLGAFLVSQDLLMTFLATYYIMSGLPGGSDGKEFACNAGDLSLISCSGRSLEKEMAIHFVILAWEISWTEKPGGLHSMESQRGGKD